MRRLFFMFFMLTLSGVMAQEKVKFMLFADLHYDIMPDADERLSTILKQAAKQKADFILELGDFIPPTPQNRAWKHKLDKCGLPVYHVLGNHDIDQNNKQLYMDYWGIPSSYYYFDKGCFRFIVLDSNFFVDKDGVTKPYDKGNYGRVDESDRNKYSKEELAWLDSLLQDKTRIHVLFSHAPVNDLYSEVVLNAEIHALLVNAQKRGTQIAMIFGGHMHSDNYHLVDGIHYMQVNSASNIWGGAKFMNTDRYPADINKKYPSLRYVIPYKDPLYAVVEIDSKGDIEVHGMKSRYVPPLPDMELLKTKPYPCSPDISTLKLTFPPAVKQEKKKDDQVVKLGIISDVHDEQGRLKDFIDRARQENPDLILQLGDLSDGSPEKSEKMLNIWNAYPGRSYHVLGNHDMDRASKAEVVERQKMPGAYYSFDCGPFHFVVLDCNYLYKDGCFVDFGYANYYIDKLRRDLITPEQVEWLKKDVMATDKEVILLSHQTFDDVVFRGANPVPNRSMVQDVIREINRGFPADNRKIIACIAGHDHVDYYSQKEGVHYLTINSALGFKRGLEIKDSLYGFIILNARKRTISVKGVQSEFMHLPTAEDYGHYPQELIHPFIKNRVLYY